MSNTVKFTCEELDISVSVLLGEAVPTITSGFGGVSEVGRVRRKPLTDYSDIPLIRQTFTVVFAGYVKREIQDSKIKVLERMAGLFRKDDALPVVKVSGPVRFTSYPWLIESYEEGPAIRDAEGNFLQLTVSLTLVEFVDPHTVASKPGRRPKGRGKAGKKSYTVKRGDTLKSIAHKQLGSPQRWKEIAKLNKIRSNTSLKPGMKLRLP